ncbi:MAG: hypothetical protein ACYTGC_16695, partial [Planctomycetota bacterium]
RLEALDPDRPLDYFELAEEVADAAATPADGLLAHRLFGLAGALDPPRLGRSAALALADLEEEPLAKRRLHALAWLLGGRSAAVGPVEESVRTWDAGSNATILAVIDAFSLYRRGYGNRATSVLRQPGAMELLEALDPVLPGGVNRFLEDCRVYRNGQLAPRLSEDEITRMLRIESALLSGSERAWSGELLLSRGTPLIEVDPDRLADALGVDVSRPVYRRGRWARR